MQVDFETTYTLVLIDIERYTRLASDVRERIVPVLRRKLYWLNRKLRPCLALPLRLGYGDEVAALMTDVREIYTIVDELRESLHPRCKLRFVVVRGKIGVRSHDVRRVGGEAFKKGAEAMAALKRKGGFCSWATGQPFRDRVLEVLTELANAMIEAMTDYQRAVWRLLRRGRGRAEIAASLGKHHQSVSTAAIRGQAQLVDRSESLIRELLAANAEQPKMIDSQKATEND